jgi:HAD superfamily hydrolase (TIGR01509 family)
VQEQVNLIIFDCDGVLIDSEIVVCRLASEELTRAGYPISLDEVIQRFAGRSEPTMIAEIERDWQQPVPAEYFNRIRSRIEEAYASELHIIPGVRETLERIESEKCVASSSYPDKLQLGLRSTGLLDLFQGDVISASRVARGKPAPDVFIYAAGWMRTPVASCLVVEDSVPGVQAARAAGMRVIGFTGGRHCRSGHGARLLDAGAECVIDRMELLGQSVPEAFGGRSEPWTVPLARAEPHPKHLGAT